MKKSLSILLISLIIFNAGGVYFIHSQLENYFKKIAFSKANEYISTDILERIRIYKNQDNSENTNIFERVNSREIRYYGNMYDIIGEETDSVSTTYYCISDSNENILNEAFADYLNGNNEAKSNKAISNIIKLLNITALEPAQLIMDFLYQSDDIMFSNKIFYSDIILDTPIPPPKINS